MQTPLLANRLGRWLAVLLLTLLLTPRAQAQLTGAKAIPGSGSTGYATLAAAIADLNTQGVGAGGVTFNIAAGYTETFASPTAGAITATGTAANPIVFQKSSTGANPVITAGVGTTTTLDAIISLSGSDYVTFDGLSLTESAANTTATTQAEFGFALFRASATDGCQNNIIRNCVVTLVKTNTATIGIAGLSSASTATTAVTATSTTGANSNNLVYGNIVTNALKGIDFSAGSATAVANYDQNNQVGVTPTGGAAGNTVGNFGGVTTSGWGIGANYQNGFRVANNTLNNTLNYTSATTSTAVAASTVTTTVRGIYCNTGTSASIDIVNNTVTLASGATTSQMSGIENGIGSTAANNTVNITGNTVTNCSYATATSATFYGIYNTASAATVNLTGNNLTNNTLGAAASAATTFNGIYNSGVATLVNMSSNTATGNVHYSTTGLFVLVYGGAPTTLNLNNNTVTGNNKAATTTGTSGSMYCLQAIGGSITATGNTVNNNTLTSGGTSSGTLWGYYNFTTATTETLTNNTFSNLTVAGTGTSTAHTAGGIRSFTGTTDLITIAQNVVQSVSITAGSGTVHGIYVSSSVPTGNTISRNRIGDLSAVGSAGAVNGIFVAGGGVYTVSNNLVGDFRTPASTGLVAINGLQVSGSSGVNAYYNTIYLNASSSGATFGTSGIYLSSTTVPLDVRNNLVVNTSVAAGTGGYTVALRRVSGTNGTIPSNLAGASNNNLYYAGTPSATNLIYVEGTTTATNAMQTLAAYKSFLLNREANSVTETNTPFASTSGTAANFLHLTPGAATQAESAGQAISGITTDYDGDTRNATTPDIGADEGAFQLVDVTGPTIVINSITGSLASTTSRTLTATITDASGVATGANAPRLYFRKGSSGAFVASAAPTVAGSTYTFTFDYSLVGGVVAGDVIQYYVAAQDALGNNSTNPTGGSFTTTPPVFYAYTVAPTLSGTYYVSANSATSPVPARTYATLTAAVAAYNGSGLAGPVTFLLLDPTYSTSETFPIAILNNTEASATNTLTIKPSNATGTTSFAITGSNATAILQLLASDYVTIDGSLGNTISSTDPRPSRDLTVTNTNAGTSSVVIQQFAQFVSDGATYNTIKNLTAVGANTASTAATLYGIHLQGTSNATTTNQYTNNTVQNCAVRGAQVGIASIGGTIALKNQSNVITQNDLNATGAASLTRGGILSQFDNGALITLNNIGGIVNTNNNFDSFGISLGFGSNAFASNASTGSETTNTLVSQNYIGTVSNTNTYSAIGIGVATATTGTNTIANNFVSGVLGNGTVSDFAAGIFVNGSAGGGSTRVLYNSVSMTGTATGGSQPVVALAIGGTTPTVEVRNNVLYNSQTTGGSTYAFGLGYTSTVGNYVGLTSTNNAFFGTTGVGATGGLGSSGTTRATLADLNAETGQDRPTTATNPVGTSLTLTGLPFVSTTDLHAVAPALNNAGVPVSGITIDYDGETRSATTPDIGGDEFMTNLDVAAAALVSPVAGNSCFSNAEAVTVSIRNASTVALDFAANPVTVTVTITPPGTGSTPVTFTTIVNTGTLAANATQNVTLPGTADLSAAGAYAVTVTTSLPGDDNVANNTLAPALTITSAPRSAAFTYTGLPATICAGSAATFTPTLGTGATAGTFSAGTGLTINATTGVINPATSAAGTYTVTNTLPASGGCAVTTATQTVTITPGTTATFSYTGSPFCKTSTTNPAPTITGTAGGTFSSTSGLTIDATTGAITLSSSTAGTYTVTYSVGGPCPSSTTQSVTITNAPTAAFSYPTTAICAGQSATVAPTLGTGASSGTFTSTTGLTINATTGVITPSTSTAGTYTVTNTVAASGTCAAVTSTATVTISPATTATFSYAGSPFCRTATADVTPSITGTSGGTFSSTTGLSINATTGAITPSTSTAGTYTVTYSVSGTCPSSTTQTVVINSAPVASFTYPSSAICVGQAATVSPSLGTGATAGTFSAGTGLTINATTGVINPATSTAGTYTVTNTVAASGGCAAVTSTQSVMILPLAVATFNYGTGSTFCVSGTTNPTVTLGTGATAGTFSSTTGLTLNATTGAITLSSSTPGTYTVTNTVAASGSACANTATTTVTITAAPVAAFSYGTGSTFCVSGTTNPAVVLGTGATAGTFSSTTGLTLNATTGAITLGSSTPGTYTVTNTVAASGGCAATTATSTVTITAAPVASFTYGATSTFCVSGTTNPTVTLGTGATAGTFTVSPATGLTVNATTGAITLSSSTPGTYTVTNTIAAAGGCAAATATATVTVTAAQLATFSYPTASICAGQTATVSPALATGATAGTFSSTAGLTISAAGVINPATSTAGTYTVTNTVAAAGGCAAVTSTATVTINAVPATPTATVTYPTVSTAQFSSSAAPAGTTYQWYLNGVAIPGATGQTYTANGATSPGAYTVRFLATATGCQSAPSAATTITAARAAAGTALTLFPNPTRDGNVTLQLSGYRQTVTVTVLDATGRLVLTQSVPAGQGQVQLNLTGLAQGVYLLRASTAGGTDTRRLVLSE